MDWPTSDDAARAMYAGGRADPVARRFARAWGGVFACGLAPRRWVRLEVPGRRTGRVMRIPIGLADVDGRWYAVSMLGECNWVRNAQANGGRVVLRHLLPNRCTLVEIPVDERAPILRRYLEVAPGGRPHIPATASSPEDDLHSVAVGYPTFEVRRLDGRPYRPRRTWPPVALAVAMAFGIRRFGLGRRAPTPRNSGLHGRRRRQSRPGPRVAR